MKTILFIGGWENHPPGCHEVLAVLRLLSYCIEQSDELGEVRTAVFDAWPTEPHEEFDAVLPEADCLVFIGDVFPLTKLDEDKQEAAHARLDEVMKQGVGLVCLHYATAAPSPGHALMDWAGGHWVVMTKRTDDKFEGDICRTTPDHPVSRGWDTFHLLDEVYYEFQFGEGGIEKAVTDGVTPIIHTMLPPEEPNKEVVGWAYERKAGGRSFMAYVTHYFINWANDDLRTMVLNGIAWATGLGIPENGVQSTLPQSLSVFEPKAVYTDEYEGMRDRI